MRKMLAAGAALIMMVIAMVVLPAESSVAAPSSVARQASPKAAPSAAAYILVDSDTGNVLAAKSERTPMSPASTTKLLTALVVASHMDRNERVAINSPEPERMPALKIGVRQGEIWSETDLMHALLMVSANDAAVALAEHVSGSVASFAQTRREAAAELGLMDNPVLNDPAGLDDSEFSNDGGDMISARDMAIVARAALGSPEIREIVSESRYDFTGLDGKPHHMLNHNGMLKTYNGSIGMKTGYTRKARHTLVAAASRQGRTMVAVVLGSEDPAGVAAKLMDTGFALPASNEPTTDYLPLTSVAGKVVDEQAKPAVPVAASHRRHSETFFVGIAFAVVVSMLLMSNLWRYRQEMFDAWDRRQRPLTGRLD